MQLNTPTLFGRFRLEMFSGLSKCLIAMTQMGLLDELPLKDLRDVNPFLGPLFFILFLTVMVFMIMSMFVAITSHAMESVRVR